MSKHTPGPWVANHRYVETKDKIICEVFGGNRKDALLIASAPDLLEALQDIIDNIPPLWECAERAQAAIDKATGEQA